MDIHVANPQAFGNLAVITRVSMRLLSHRFGVRQSCQRRAFLLDPGMNVVEEQ